VQGLLAVRVNPSSLHRRGAPSPLDYLRSLIAADGHVRYARGSDQTPTWVTGEALMALEGKPLPVAAPARRTTPAAAPRKNTHSTPRAPVAPAPAHHAARRSKPRRSRQRPRVVTPPPVATTADRLVVDAGILTAVSLAFVGGS
jgi:hypothetical protein